MTDWDRLARFYDRQLPLERPALRALLDMLEPGEADRLLDVGTGTGALLRELAMRSPRPERAIGVDRSPKMLAAAARLPAGWELVHGGAEHLSFTDASFDVASATYLLHLLDRAERLRILGELRRVLRADGRVGIITVASPRTPVGGALSAPIRALARRSGGALAGLRTLDPSPDLAAAGFRVTARRRVLRGYPSLCVVAVRPR